MYVELHSHSAFSFLEGASLPEALALTAADLGLAGMAVLDRNGFYGSPRFHMAAKKSGLCAHVGAELSVSDESGTAFYPLLCETRTGYQNLCRLITRTKLRVPKHSESSARLKDAQRHGLIVKPIDVEEFASGRLSVFKTHGCFPLYGQLMPMFDDPFSRL
jgi:error-prone DNA polymerase